MALGGIERLFNGSLKVLDGLQGIAKNVRDLGNVVGNFSGAFTSGVFAGFTFDLAVALGTSLTAAANELKEKSKTASAKDPKAMLELTAAAEAYRAAATQAQNVIAALGDASKTLSRNG